jgi:molybdopterin synthase sulfur carrier subunit
MQVRVYATLRDLLGASTIDLDINLPTDVEQVLRQAVAAYPQLADKLWDADHSLSGFIQVLVNGRSIQFLAGLATPVTDGDRVDLFPPVGGG